MGHGIRVWNADGSLQFDIGNRLMMSLADFDMGTANGSVVVPDLTLGGAIVSITDSEMRPTVTVTGTTVAWNYGSTPNHLRGGKLNVLVY